MGKRRKGKKRTRRKREIRNFRETEITRRRVLEKNVIKITKT